MFPNPGNDIARISRNRRTSASRTAVLNMGQSPRIYSGASAPKKKKEETGVEGRVREYHHGNSNNVKSVEGEEVAGNAIQATTTMRDTDMTNVVGKEHDDMIAEENVCGKEGSQHLHCKTACQTSCQKEEQQVCQEN